MPNGKERVRVDGRELVLTNLEKIMYPETGTTKADVLAYYAAVAPVLIPAARNRPATRKRWVHGVGTADAPGEMFFQKNLDHSTPGWVPRAAITHKDRTIQYPLVNDPATLTWLAQIAALEIHVPQWRVDSHGNAMPPDRLVLDLDPGEGAGLAECVEVARLARTILQDVGLDPVPVTSGSKGIHLYAGPGRVPELGPDFRLRPRTGPLARGRPPGSRRQRHEEDPAHGQGAGGLEPEQRRQDHHRAVLAARPAPADGGRPAHMAGTQLRVAAPAGFPGGDEARRSRQGSVRPGFRRPARRRSPRRTRRTAGRTTGSADGPKSLPSRPATAATPIRGWKSTAPNGTGRPLPSPSPRTGTTPGTTAGHGGRSSSSRSTTPAGCTTTSGWNATACWCPGRCPRASRPAKPRTTSRSRPRTTRWTTPTSRVTFPRASTAPGRSASGTTDRRRRGGRRRRRARNRPARGRPATSSPPDVVASVTRPRAPGGYVRRRRSRSRRPTRALRRLPPDTRPASASSSHAVDDRDRAPVDLGGEAALARQLVQVAEQAEAGDVGHARVRPRPARRRRAAVERRHDVDRRGERARRPAASRLRAVTMPRRRAAW